MTTSRERASLTGNDVYRELLSVAVKAREANGGRDYVYTPGDSGRCEYVERDSNGDKIPGCLIGTWLHDVHGVPLHVLHQYEGLDVRDLFGDEYPVKWGSGYASFPQADGPIREWVPNLAGDERTDRHKIVAFLRAAQNEQDGGNGWVTAVDTAERLHSLGGVYRP